MRIAFLLERPASTTKPTWVKMLISSLVHSTPATPPSRHEGMMRMTAAGNAQLSNWAAKTRKTMTMAMANSRVPDPSEFSSR